MKPLSFMLIAGEASGDTLAAELVGALRARVLEISSEPTEDAQPLRTALAPHFFGAGGPKMAAAGVELAVDLTQHSVIGVSDVLKHLRRFRRLFHDLLALASERQPDVIIGVDYGGFNLRFAQAIKGYVRRHHSQFKPWNPKIVQFVSPQVWASRPGRARALERTHDLVLSIFPFEKEWYAARVPKLRVEFVGHPMVERFPTSEIRIAQSGHVPRVVLLPGSRWDEVRRHWQMILTSAALLAKDQACSFKAVFPNQELADRARSPEAIALAESLHDQGASFDIQVGGVGDALAEADLAITKSGTITMECALHGVPAVVFYRTSWLTYWIAKRLVNVKHLAMPNLLAGEELFPEFIQSAATPENIAHAAMALLQDEARRAAIKATLARVVASLGGPGASQRAAEAIVSLLS